MKKKAKSIILNIVIWAMLISGLALLLYPAVSDSRNKSEQLERIVVYDTAIQELGSAESERWLRDAQSYNEELRRHPVSLSESGTDSVYAAQLNIDGSGIMGYVTIPSINVKLPIYHSTSAEVLDIGAGHLHGTSLPVGGVDTHAVISAHTGLPSARLFTDVEKMKIGDTFTISVLDRELTYEVESIFIIEPTETGYLSVISGVDYVTLMTCTPYGVNSHRLLVRSKRVEVPEERAIRIYADAVKVDPMITYTVISIPLFIILLAVWIFNGRRGSGAAEPDKADQGKDE